MEQGMCDASIGLRKLNILVETMYILVFDILNFCSLNFFLNFSLVGNTNITCIILIINLVAKSLCSKQIFNLKILLYVAITNKIQTLLIKEYFGYYGYFFS
jgi:hypothetical protein